jgi:hypothetical protein
MTIYFIAYIILCLIVGVYGSKRDFGFYGFFIASIIFTPLIVLAVLLLSKPKKDKESLNPHN